MSQDIFGRTVDIGQPIAADAARLLFAGGGESMLVQNVSVGYQQNVSRLWEVNGSKQYFVAGRTQGTIQIGRVLGPTALNKSFIQQYGDVCQVAGNHMTFDFQAGCEGGANVASLTCSGCVIISLTLAIAAQDMVVNEQMALMFARLN